MHDAFKPVDHKHRAHDKLRTCSQTGSVINYTAVFHAQLLECTDVSNAKALDCCVAGLKPTTRDWDLIHDPSTMHKAAKWAERYNNTYFSHQYRASSLV